MGGDHGQARAHLSHSPDVTPQRQQARSLQSVAPRGPWPFLPPSTGSLSVSTAPMAASPRARESSLELPHAPHSSDRARGLHRQEPPLHKPQRTMAEQELQMTWAGVI